MAEKYLGDRFDIHIGGEDHIPIHHTNEIAQCQAKNGHIQANFWLHGYFLRLNREKISKSGVSLTLDRLIKEGYKPLAYRYLTLTGHYRSQMSFTWEALTGAQKALQRLKRKLESMPNDGIVNENYRAKFFSYVNQDLNMPQALALAWEMIDSHLSPANKKATVIFFDAVFGLDLNTPERLNIPKEVQELVELRQRLKDQRQYDRADAIREKIHELGYQVNDEGAQSSLLRL